MNLSLSWLGSSHTQQFFAATVVHFASKTKVVRKKIPLSTVLMVLGSRSFALIYGLGDSTPAVGAYWV